MSGADHPIPELDAAGLRHFALTTGAIVAVLFGLVLPWLFEFRLPVWPWVVGGTLALWGVVAAPSLRPVYRGWMRFGLLLNRIVSPVVLGILFFGMFTPIALAFRLFGRDAMARRFDADAATYRVASARPPKEHVERPF